jgi:hypothetical protein
MRRICRLLPAAFGLGRLASAHIEEREARLKARFGL